MDEIINIDPKGLEEKGKLILAEANNIKEALQDIEDAKNLLAGWISPNKDKYEAKVNNILPKMQEMVDALNLYGTIAVNKAEKVLASENIIASKIDEDLM